MSNKLSATFVAQAKIAPGLYGDGNNLYLTVSPTGARSWVFIWKQHGRRRELGLGSATGAGSTVSVSLKAARLAADRVRIQIADGIDPIAIKAKAKIGEITFEQLMLERVASLQIEGGWKVDAAGNCQQADQWTGSLRQHAAKLLPMKVALIGDKEVFAVLKPIWKTIPTTAERVRDRIAKVFELAIAKEVFAGQNPARYQGHVAIHVGPRATTKASTEVHHAAMAYTAAPAFVQRLLTHKGNAARALAFLMLTAARSDEVRSMKRSEVDFDKGVWTVPASRMKAGVEHIVPLSTAALAILRSMPEIVGNEFMFPGTKAGQQLNGTALSDKLQEMGVKRGEATVHGMRSTFRDWVNVETHFAAQDAEACLAHSLDKVERAYARMAAVEKRRAILQAWAAYCEGKSNLLQLVA